MTANFTFFPMRGIMLLFLLASVCYGQEKVPGSPNSSQGSGTAPQMAETENLLRLSERLLAGVDGMIKTLQDQYVIQRKEAALLSEVSGEESKEANKRADEIAVRLKAMSKEREALAAQIKSFRSLLDLAPDAKKSDAPAATTAPPGQAPAEGGKKSN